jgi:DNA repair exonuclease SbcCD ATPase subunit
MKTSHVEMLRLLGKAFLDNDELKREIKDHLATIAEQKKELDALQWASVMGYPPVCGSEAEEKVWYLEKELAYKDEQVAELRKSVQTHPPVIFDWQTTEISDLRKDRDNYKKAWAVTQHALVESEKKVQKITKLKPVGTFNSIEWDFGLDKTYVTLDGQFTLYEVKE